GTCSALTVKVPSKSIHAVEGKALVLPVEYNFSTKAQEIQITWICQRPDSHSSLLVTAKNDHVVVEMQYEGRISLDRPNASLFIRQLELSDEGDYIVKISIKADTIISANQTIHVSVDAPVSKPVVHSIPVTGAVEFEGNVTLTCSVKNEKRVIFQWLKRDRILQASPRRAFSPDNKTLFIRPVRKEDISNYSCLVKNPVSQSVSEPITPIIYYGPYSLAVSSDKGQKVDKVVTVDIGEVILFHCSADSNPPNTYSWVQKFKNRTEVLKLGPEFEVKFEKEALRKADYTCCAYNNITGKHEETQFTIIVLSEAGQEKLAQKGSSLSPLAVITAVSLFLILCMFLLFLKKRCNPHTVIKQQLYSRPPTEYMKTRSISGNKTMFS
uniref:HEPACAM family member 2 n=1 Tax=Latimeria chalumnae TaxID=7897 RepID=H3AD79_LATCH